MDYRSILITGGLGQIGSYICESLSDQNRKVTILDNKASKDAVKKNLKIVKGDVCDKPLVNRLVEGSDVIIHCAAQIFVARSVDDPCCDAENNIMGTLNLLEAARNARIKRFVFFSSAAVYGDTSHPPVGEDHPQDPLSPYGVSKLAGEKYALAFNKVYGLPTTAIRPFNVYSPRQDPSNPYSGVISKFIDRVSKGKPPIIFGDGTATRDFVSVHDVVDMVALMLENDEAVGKVFNCDTGNPTRIDELARTIIDQYGNDKLRAELLPERPGDINHSYADISLARKVLGYSPRVSLKDGLREIIMSKRV